MFGFELDPTDFLFVALILYLFYLTCKVKNMALSDTLSSAVSSLDANVSALASAIDTYKANAKAGSVPDDMIQQTIDKLNAIGAVLQMNTSKLTG